MKYREIADGIFVDRPNRFIAHVEVNGAVETVHVKNTGRCRELLLPGTAVRLEVSDNPKRKTKYDLVAVHKQGLGWEFHETDQIGLRMGDWKMVVKKGVPHLYNLAEDIHEDHDVAAQHPDLVNQMKQVILREHRPNDLFPVTLPK